MQKYKHKIELKNVKQAKKSNPKVEIGKDKERRKEKKTNYDNSTDRQK